MAENIIINEVGLRDGLQNHPVRVATADKLRLLEALLAAGIRHLEPVSFVHPKLVPAMADAAALTELLPQDRGVEYTALVPNLKGYELARAAGYTRIALVISTTDSFNQRNLKMSLADAITSSKQILAAARADGVTSLSYISGALVCPYDGPVKPAVSQKLAEEMLTAGSDEIAIADTVGGGEPRQLQMLLRSLLKQVDASRFTVHLHDTRGLAQTLAWVAVEEGIRRFDASIGGLGGCPFAPGATGNVATEDLVYLFESAGFATGIDMDGLRAAVTLARELTQDASLGGRILRYLESQEKAGRPCRLL
jgi:hydroxymethylglutaryl-CoA lyase